MRNRNQNQNQFHLGTFIRNIFLLALFVVIIVVASYAHFSTMAQLKADLFGETNTTVPTPIVSVDTNETNETNLSTTLQHIPVQSRQTVAVETTVSTPTVKVDTRSLAETIKDEQYNCDKAEAEFKRWGTPISEDTRAQCVFVRSANIVISKENGLDHYRFVISAAQK